MSKEELLIWELAVCAFEVGKLFAREQLDFYRQT
jgi:hypothetical protein